jgi:hypothetical protein
MSRYGVAAQAQRITSSAPVTDKLIWQASVTLSNANAQSLGLGAPTDSAAVGDLFLVFVWARSAIATPAGFTLVKSESVVGAGQSAGNTQNLACFSKIVASGDINTTFTFSQTATGRMGYVSARYRKAASLSGTPVVQGAVSGNTPQLADTTSMPMQPTTPTAIGQKVVTALTRILSLNNATETLVPPPGFTIRSAGGEAVGYRCGVAEKAADSLTSVTGNWTTNQTGENAIAVMSLLLDVV